MSVHGRLGRTGSMPSSPSSPSCASSSSSPASCWESLSPSSSPSVASDDISVGSCSSPESSPVWSSSVSSSPSSSSNSSVGSCGWCGSVSSRWRSMSSDSDWKARWSSSRCANPSKSPPALSPIHWRTMSTAPCADGGTGWPVRCSRSISESAVGNGTSLALAAREIGSEAMRAAVEASRLLRMPA